VVERTLPRPLAGTIALGVLCLGALGIATNIATSALPQAWSPYRWLSWTARPLLPLAGAFAFPQFFPGTVPAGDSVSISAPGTPTHPLIKSRIYGSLALN
jgi:hypothetical protein